jgi:hypothetical protein
MVLAVERGARGAEALKNVDGPVSIDVLMSR